MATQIQCTSSQQLTVSVKLILTQAAPQCADLTEYEYVFSIKEIVGCPFGWDLQLASLGLSCGL